MCHCPVTDENSPYIGACFGNHQHADKWDGVCPKYDRDIESKAQNDGQPHPAERAVFLHFCLLIEKNDDEQA